VYRDFGVVPEVEQGIIELLFTAAFPSGDVSPFTVITRDHALWTTKYPQREMTILDVTPTFGRLGTPIAVWGSQLEREVKRQLLSVGWPASQIVAQYQREQAPAPMIPDFGLLDDVGNLAAILEVKGMSSLLGATLAQTINTGKTLASRFAIVTNGEKVLIYDSKSDMTTSRDQLPTPEEVGLEVKPLNVEPYDDGPVRVVPILERSEIAQRLHKFQSHTLIFDHTMPWGNKPDVPTSLFDLGTSEEKMDSTVGICLASMCFSSSYRKKRSELTYHFQIAGIVELPSDILKPYANVKSCLISLRRSRPNSEREKSYFLALSSRDELIDCSTRPWFTSLKKGLSGRETDNGFRATVNPGEPWTIAAHHPGNKRIETELSKYATVTLGDVCEIKNGFRHSRDEVVGGRGVAVVRGRDISRGIDSKEELTHYRLSESPPEDARLLAGDVLFQRIGSTPACMIVPPSLTGAIASDTTIVVRSKDEQLSPFAIFQFFSSSIGRQLLTSISSGVSAPTLSVTALRQLKVPLLPRELYSGLDELTEIEQALRTKADKLRSLRLDLFGIESQTTPEQRLQEIRQTAKAISASIGQAESQEFQIRNFYPYPLAFLYRSLASNTVHGDLYRDQLRLAENIIAFVASVSLALVSPPDRASSGIDLRAYWRKGISPGDWREISQKCSRILISYRANPIAQALAALWNDRRHRTFRDRIDQLISRKNDFKHDRGPKNDEDFEAESAKTNAALADCMGALGFLAEYPLRLIRDMSRIRGGREVTLVTLTCMGDHPGFGQQQMTYPDALTKNDLYIEIEKDNWNQLYPFLLAHNCSQCNNREFYFVDRWPDKNGLAVLKSFERGHTYESGEAGEELARWPTS